MAYSKDVKVMFMPEAAMTLAPKGITVMEAAHMLGIKFSAPCGGRGACGKCRVKILTGEFTESGISSNITAFSPSTADEMRFLSNTERVSGIRLACQARLLNDAVLEIMEVAEEDPEIVSKDITRVNTALNPAVKVYPLTDCRVDKNNPPFSLLSLVQEELTARFGLPQLYFDTPALSKLTRCVANGNFNVLVWNDREVLDLRPTGALLGAAVDIGSTSVGAYLCDLTTGEVLKFKAEQNPQAAHGGDIISRISYQYGQPDKLAGLQREIINCVNGMLMDLCVATGHSLDEVADMVVVGNPVMLHLFFGVAPDTIGVPPHIPAVSEILDLKTRDVGLKINPAAYVQCLPGLTGFVGGDVVADVLALKENLKAKDTCLVLDVGANTEILLKHGQHLLTAVCATGSALNAAGLSCGAAAQNAPGAVEHVFIDPYTYSIRVKLSGQDKWFRPGEGDAPEVSGFCATGIIDIVGQLYKAGFLEPNGRFVNPAEFERMVVRGEESRFILFKSNENAKGAEISVSQSDIRAVQAAKGVLYGSCRLLMQKAGLEQVDGVLLSSGAGVHMDALSAFDMGLFPAQRPVDVEFFGNSAGYGALLALLNLDERNMALELSRVMEYVELAGEENFNAVCNAGMAFPTNQTASNGFRF